MPALSGLLIMAAVLAGCASSATTARRALPGRIRQPRQPAGTSWPHFTSRHYGYTEALPAGWLPAAQATQQWDGTGAPGDQDSVVDLFQGPGGVEA
jgi:hypothetical protein